MTRILNLTETKNVCLSLVSSHVALAMALRLAVSSSEQWVTHDL
jgi:hypothetical protein